jgi:hypothetical protein
MNFKVELNDYIKSLTQNPNDSSGIISLWIGCLPPFSMSIVRFGGSTIYIQNSIYFAAEVSVGGYIYKHVIPCLSGRQVTGLATQKACRAYM